MTLWFPHFSGVAGWIEDFLIGHWPEGDEDAMRRVAGHWSDMATALRELQQPADHAMNTALSAIDGKTHDAMSSYWQDIVGGDGSDLKSMIQACDSFAKQLEQGATDIEYAKIAIYISVAAMVAMAFIPGVGEVLDAAALFAVKLFIRKTVEELINKLALKGAAFLAERAGLAVAAKLGEKAASEVVLKASTQAVIGAGFGTGTDVAAQGIQLAQGHRDGIDLRSVGTAAAAGAVAGAVAGPIAERSTQHLASTLGTDIGTNTASAILARGAVVIPANIAGNTAATAASAATTGGHLDFSTVVDGAGAAGFARTKPGGTPHTAPEATPTPSAHPEPIHESPTSTGSKQSSPAAVSASATQTDTAPPATTHTETNTTPATATTAAVNDAPSVPSAAAATHENPAVPQSDSTTGKPAETRSVPSDPHPATAGTPAPDHGSTAQPPATSATPTPGRPTGHTPETVPPNGIGSSGDRSAATSAPRVPADTPQRVEPTPRSETPAPPTDRGAPPQRVAETPRSPSGVDMPDRAAATPPARETISSAARVDSAPLPSTDRTFSTETSRTASSPTHEGAASPTPVPRDTPPPSPREAVTPEHPRGSDPGPATTPSRHGPSATQPLGPDHNTGPRTPDRNSARPTPDFAQRPDPTERPTPQPATHTRAVGDQTPPTVAVVVPPHPSSDTRAPNTSATHPKPEPGEHRPPVQDKPPANSSEHAPRDIAAPPGRLEPAGDPHRTKLPVEDKPYYSNPAYHDPTAEREYARNRTIGPEAAEIRATKISEYPELARLSDAEIELIRRNQFMSLNEPVNDGTRNGDRALLDKHDVEIRALVSAYNKLPDHNGVIYRSLYIDDPVKLAKFIDEYRRGNTPTDHGFASADKGSSMPGGNIELVIDSRHGKDVSWASSQQDEVVFPPGTRFQVESVVRDGQKVYIHLQDLGRSPDAHQSRGLGSDHAESGGTRRDAAPAVPRETSSSRQELGDRSRDGSERASSRDRGADQDLASLGRLGTETDRSGTRRDDGVTTETPVRQYDSPTLRDEQSSDSRHWPHSDAIPENRDSHRRPHEQVQPHPEAERLRLPPPEPVDRPVAQTHPDSSRPQERDRGIQAPPHRPESATAQQKPMDESATAQRSPVPPPAPESTPQRWAHQDPNYVANSARLPDWWPRTESAPPQTAESRPPVASLPSTRAPESLPPTPRPRSTPPQSHASTMPVSPPRNQTPHTFDGFAPRRPSPTHAAPGPHDAGHPTAPAHREPRHRLGDRDARQDHDPLSAPEPGSKSPHHPDPPEPRRPIDPETQRALDTRNARDNYRHQTPEDDRVIDVPRSRANNTPAYEVRRYAEGPNQHVAVARVRVHIEAGDHISPHELHNLIENSHRAIDLALNDGRRLLSGDWLMVDVVFTNDPSTAHLHAIVDHTPGPNTWHPNDRPSALVDRIREHLGLSDTGPLQELRPADIRQISNDIARANTPAKFRELPETREFSPRRLNPIEDPAFQAAVEDALRAGNQFVIGADPRTNPYGELINDGGSQWPGRNNNCIELALSALSSFHGDPQVGAPRWLDLLPDGRIDTNGETGGPDRAQRFLGGRWQTFDGPGMPIPEQFQSLQDWVKQMGPGSSALLVNSWHARDPHTGEFLYNQDGTPVSLSSHATVIVYPHGADGPVWWDPQAKTMSDSPPPRLTGRSSELWFMTNDATGGSHSARTDSNPGTGETVPGTHLRDGSTVPDIPDRVRLGLPENLDTGANRGGAGTGTGELRDQRPHRSGDRALESPPGSDRGDVRRGDPYGTTGSRTSGISTEVAHEHPTDTGRLAGDRVPDGSDVVNRAPGIESRPSTGDQQAEPVLQPDRQDDSAHSRMGGDAQPDGRDLASPRDIRVLDADLPTPVAGEHPTHARELPDDRVPRTGAVDDAPTGTNRGIAHPATEYVVPARDGSPQATDAVGRDSQPRHEPSDFPHEQSHTRESNSKGLDARSIVDPEITPTRRPTPLHDRTRVDADMPIDARNPSEPHTQPPRQDDPRGKPTEISSLRDELPSAVDAYNSIRNADDINAIVEQLDTVRRADGSRYTHADIEAIKDHLFYEQHPLTAVDGSIVHAHFEANPDIAEAWVRLRSGKYTESDVRLLEHELAEHDYLTRNPDATYADAHRAANEIANWERNRQPAPREDTAWDGPVHREERTQPSAEQIPDGRQPVPGQTGAEIRRPSDITGPNGERIWEIPRGSRFGEGTNSDITNELRRLFNVGAKADPTLPPTLCSYCRCNIATDIDHVLPRKSSGDLGPHNVTPACDHCNTSKLDRVAPVNPAPNQEGVFPPPHWPEEMRHGTVPYSHYPRIQERLEVEIWGVKQQFLQQAEQKAKSIAQAQGITSKREIRRIEREQLNHIDREYEKLRNEVWAAIRRVDFDPKAFEAWTSNRQRVPIDLKVGVNPIRMVFIRDDGPEGGTLTSANSYEHFVANVLQEARGARDIVHISRDSHGRLVTGHAEILVSTIEEAQRYGRGEDVPEWEPDRGNALAARYEQGLAQPPEQTRPERSDAEVLSPKMIDPHDRADMTLAERENARDEARRDRDRRKEIFASHNSERYWAQTPGERDEFEQMIEQRQRARDVDEAKLDASEHKRDQRARDEPTPEQRAADAREEDLDTRERARLMRDWMRDQQEIERYDRTLRGDSSEHSQELDSIEQALDDRDRELDRRETDRINRERLLAREGVELSPEQVVERELDDRERVAIERARAQTIRMREHAIEGRETPERIRELDTRALELDGRELARIDLERALLREGREPTAEEQKQRELNAREREIDAREREIIERERERVVRQLELARALEQDGRESPERARVRELDGKEQVIDARERARVDQERELAQDGRRLTREQLLERELDAREREIIERERTRITRQLEREREGRETPERIRELDTRALELDGRELARIDLERALLREGREPTAEEQKQRELNAREREIDAREREIIERERERVVRQLELARALEQDGRESPERARVRELDGKEQVIDARERARVDQERELAQDGRRLTREQLLERELDAREREIIERERAQITRQLEREREGRALPKRVRELDAQERRLDAKELKQIQQEREYLQAGIEVTKFQREMLDWSQRDHQQRVAQIAQQRALELEGRDPITRLLRSVGLERLARERETRIKEARDRAERSRARAQEIGLSRDR
ncbi:toxin glutamine deamidase domain-containing protein [Nocardia sp. CA-128927]|uniref:toxin glutamine deamidase domain-containing protein n=1 Tax=Nocardia sp. CA-128927 TaxID=3239975 RepID=UPI003D973362